MLFVTEHQCLNKEIGKIPLFFWICHKYKWNHILHIIFYRVLNTSIYDFQKMIKKNNKKNNGSPRVENETVLSILDVVLLHDINI